MTNKSLIIIDEIGRGTGTADGLSIAQAIVEYLHDYGVKTLFSTHFHELIKLKLPKIHNYHFAIKEKEKSTELIFLRKLVEGGTDKSFGVHVAEMAGLPKWTIERGFELMNLIKQDDEMNGTHIESSNSNRTSTITKELHILEQKLKNKERDLEAWEQELSQEREELNKITKILETKAPESPGKSIDEETTLPPEKKEIEEKKGKPVKKSKQMKLFT